MAWLDDSSTVLADDREFVMPAINPRLQINDTGKVSRYPFPLFKVLHSWYQSFSLSRKLTKKLHRIENKIADANFEEIATATSLLRELLNAKRISRTFLHNKFATQIQVKSDQLKQSLIKKSQESLELNLSKPVSIQNLPGHSHGSVLSILNNAAPTSFATPKAVKKVPNRVYWRSTQPVFATANNVSTQVKAREGSLVYLQMPLHKLIVLLSNKMSESVLKKVDGLKLGDRGFSATPSESVCGISLKCTDFNKIEENQRPTFWKQSALLIRNILSKFNDQELKHHISELYFQTTSHYQQFKKLLHLNQHVELLEFLDTLEAQQQIIIHAESHNVATLG